MAELHSHSPTRRRARCASALVLVALVGATARADDVPGTPTPVPQKAQPTGSTQTIAPTVGAEGHSEHGSLAEVGAKLSNPISDVWAMFTQFGLTFSDGNVNAGDPKVAGNMIFEPVLPIPLYGEGDKEWRMIVRPSIPVLFGNKVPTGPNSFDSQTGLGDMLLPLPIAAPLGNWLLALGPTFTFPTSTKDAFGRQQYAVGPTGIFGYKTKEWVAGVFPQYWFGVGSRGNDQGSTPDSSNMELLYFFYYNLPNAWQVGSNPTITYDNKATSGNRWNVPIGLTIAKTTKILGRPVKFQFGMEYSVVSQDDFGQRFQIKLNVIPVIQSLIKKPLFGGGG